MRGFLYHNFMKAYISVSFNQRENFESITQTINQTLINHSINPFVFVDHYKFDLSEEKEMMQTAIDDIKSSQLLIAETSDKGIGIGIEVGYAKALNIPIIYLRNKNAEHSTTVAGISDYQIIYNNETELTEKLTAILKLL